MFNFLSFNKPNQVSIHPSIIVHTIFFILIAYLAFLIRDIIILVYLSFILMIAINPIVNKLVKKDIPRTIAIIITYICTISFLLITFTIIVPPLVKELYALFAETNLPFNNHLPNSKFDFSQLASLANAFNNSFKTIFSIITGTFSSIFSLITVIIISYYLVLDRPNLHLKTSWFTNDKKKIKKYKKFLDNVEAQLGGWVRGQIIVMSIIGLITYVGLLIIGIPYALPLAILAFMLEILPNLGPTIAAVPAIALPLLNGNNLTAGTVFIFYVLVQQLENNFILPRIMGKNANVNPLAAIITILIGFKLANIAGAFLAIPTYVIIRTIYSTWWNKKKTNN